MGNNLASTFILIVIIFVGLFFTIEILTAQPSESRTGVIVGMEFVPSSVNISGSIGTSGEKSVTTSVTKDKWSIAVNFDGIIETFKVPPEVFYRYEIGDSYEVKCKTTRLLKMRICK